MELATLGISEEHVELHRSVRRWVTDHVRAADTKALLDTPDRLAEPPTFWGELAEGGWLGLAVSAQFGGEGYGLLEAAIVAEELGRACAPGPYLSTVTVAAAIQRWGSDHLRAEALSALARGEAIGAIGVGPPLHATAASDAVRLTGDGATVVVLGAPGATWLAVPTAHGWVVLAADEVDVEAVRPVDATRPLARVGVRGGGGLEVGADRRLAPGARPDDVLAVLAGAEAVGGATWCVATAAEYAATRVQFGRPIGQFQAVKHRCADMLVRTETARSLVWDAARAADTTDDATHDPEEQALVAAMVRAVVPDASLTIAKDCVQVLGGVGYTWEHDAHLYLKRSLAVRALLGEPSVAARRVSALVADGVRRSHDVELPAAAEPIRDEVRAFVATTRAEPSSMWNRAMADAGYLAPHWPAPWGRDAGPVEQLVIDAELADAGMRRPHLQVAAWVLPTIIAHGSEAQQQRWVPPTLRGELLWCQLFSEPEAGSDLAALRTSARRDDERGGWVVTGQKVWTTMAHLAQFGLLLARTDPEAPKHDGITAMVLDMASPGVEIRPLRELTGAELFNEVFLTEVFVPDDAVIGVPGQGWEAARTTLGNERVSMASGSSFGPGLELLLSGAGDEARADHAEELGRLVADGHAVAMLGLRGVLAALEGARPGASSSVRKLVATEHEQRIQEVGLALCGPAGAIDADDAAPFIAGFLGNRALSIAGGTSDIQRNIVAERLLDLPKDP